ncbi:MAG TPA: TetR family transcriptional regulator [Steroidobacteraceae bacterium]|nr:TetR family transcriptional regulator [Steroidobacteraceae bacterium]HRX89852.1 TetR family transcriptional regulator [Steroidobacteraceae bacterium]
MARKKAPARSPAGREKILDAAEELFAERGFFGVTMRQISLQAGVDVALPNYYFGSKQGLFDAVFLRRAEILNALRSEALDRALAHAERGKPDLEMIIDAFLRPIRDAQSNSDPGWRNYCRLVALVNSSPVWARMMTSHFDGLVSKFVAALRLAVPDVEMKELYWAYHFLSGSLTLTMADTGRIDTLSGGLCHSQNARDAYSHMREFYSAAFAGLAGSRAGSPVKTSRRTKTGGRSSALSSRRTPS